MITGGPRKVTIVAVLFSVISVVVLHVVRPELSPVSHRLSEYANGPFGWMMTTAFVTLSCGLVAFGVVLRGMGGAHKFAWTIPATAMLAGVGMILSAVFETGGSQISEIVHSRASAIAVVAVVVLALGYSISPMGRAPGATPEPIGAALALLAAALAAASPLLHNTRWTGFGQRLLWLALITWLLRVTWHDARREMTSSAAPQLSSRRTIASHRGDDTQKKHTPGEQASVPEDLEESCSG